MGLAYIDIQLPLQAHGINNAIKDSCKVDRRLNSALEKAHTIVTFINDRGRVRQHFCKLQDKQLGRRLELRVSVDTRFGSKVLWCFKLDGEDPC